MIVLDTNVLSELMRQDADVDVLAWLDRQPVAQLTTTSVNVAEIRYGLERLPRGRRRTRLVGIAEDYFGSFGSRVLPFDLAAAENYAVVVAARDRLGLPISPFDGQIAAICHRTGATLATRNVPDFAGLGLDVRNPWT